MFFYRYNIINGCNILSKRLVKTKNNDYLFNMFWFILHGQSHITNNYTLYTLYLHVILEFIKNVKNNNHFMNQRTFIIFHIIPRTRKNKFSF